MGAEMPVKGAERLALSLHHRSLELARSRYVLRSGRDGAFVTPSSSGWDHAQSDHNVDDAVLLPVIASLGLDPQKPLLRVRDLQVTEVQADLGVLLVDAEGPLAKVSVWRNASSGVPLVGQFSWSCTVRDRMESRPAKVPESMGRFYRCLARETADWLYPGTSRASRLYQSDA